MAASCIASESDAVLRSMLILCMHSMAATTQRRALESYAADCLMASGVEAQHAEEKLLVICLSEAGKTFRKTDTKESEDVIAELIRTSHDLVLEAATPVSIAAFHLIVRLGELALQHWGRQA